MYLNTENDPTLISRPTHCDPVIFGIRADVFEIFRDGFTVFLPGSL